ncbi:hypothetical protein [Aromatoleum diolicum]|uniref:6-bladed beta-propeller n=1 Tax=Aromatoleum diolicum TaxID=75796 RepID=A0ABX1Q6R3_9RHOO|nr:hypothetical protein [Aromatoleum diolicum]NMG74063.1 hypothetical protein [Aromatoleum diolicum]
MLRTLVTSIMVATTVALLSGCATEKGSVSEKEHVIQLQWPAPPDPARYAYEITLRAAADIEKETEDQRLKRMLTGGSSSGEPLYKKPSAIAARKGRVYVADPPTASIVVFDAARRKTFRIGVREPNNSPRPVSLSVDDKSNVYVLDSKLKKVMVYDSLGLFQFSVGDPKAFAKPVGVAVSGDGQKIFIVDRGSIEEDDHKVIAYAPDGSELYRIGPRGHGEGQLNVPLAATVAPDGSLLVLDSGNFRIQSFDTEGRYRFSFGEAGAGLGQFSRPRSIATDREGKIFVSDASFNNVQIFDPTGRLLMWIGNSGLRNNPGEFGLLAGVAADETGRLYIADHFHNKVEVYRPVLTAEPGKTGK